jgi:hypothetical protein
MAEDSEIGSSRPAGLRPKIIQPQRFVNQHQIGEKRRKTAQNENITPSPQVGDEILDEILPVPNIPPTVEISTPRFLKRFHERFKKQCAKAYKGHREMCKLPRFVV